MNTCLWTLLLHAFSWIEVSDGRLGLNIQSVELVCTMGHCTLSIVKSPKICINYDWSSQSCVFLCGRSICSLYSFVLSSKQPVLLLAGQLNEKSRKGCSIQSDITKVTAIRQPYNDFTFRSILTLPMVHVHCSYLLFAVIVRFILMSTMVSSSHALNCYWHWATLTSHPDRLWNCIVNHNVICPVF